MLKPAERPRPDPGEEGAPMLTSMFSVAPAGIPGTGSVDARPYAAVAVRPCLLGTPAPVQGSGVPAAGPAPRFRAVAPSAAVPTGIARPGHDEQLPTTWKRAIGTTQDDGTTQNDGTTPFGNPSPGRPPS